jgi:hypothetical protein
MQFAPPRAGASWCAPAGDEDADNASCYRFIGTSIGPIPTRCIECFAMVLRPVSPKRPTAHNRYLCRQQALSLAARPSPCKAEFACSALAGFTEDWRTGEASCITTPGRRPAGVTESLRRALRRLVDREPRPGPARRSGLWWPQTGHLLTAARAAWRRSVRAQDRAVTGPPSRLPSAAVARPPRGGAGTSGRLRRVDSSAAAARRPGKSGIATVRLPWLPSTH